MAYPVRCSTLIGLNPDVIVGRVEDEVVMMNIERGNYYGLNSSASRIWQLLEQDTCIAAICEQLQQDYDVDAGVCEREVQRFIAQMIDEKLVVVKGDGADL